MKTRHGIFHIILAAFALTGCSERRSSERVEITYNCAANATEIRELQSQLGSFADSTGITVTLQPFAGEEKLYAMMAADQAPDIFYTNAVVRDRLASEGRLLDLRTVNGGDPFLQRLWPEVVASGLAADSGLYSVGNWMFTVGVYYNRDDFDEAGIAYPDTSWTWEDMKSIARRLTRTGATHKGEERYGVFIGSHFVEAVEQMNGVRLPRRSLLLDLPDASLDVYREYVGLMDQGVMPDLRRVQAMGMQAVQLLQSGKVAMLVEAVPHQALFETLGIRWGVAPLPRFAGKPVRYFQSGSGGLSISGQTRHPDQAWAVLKWLISEARTYQPNPVLQDRNFVAGWEARYPGLDKSGFREVWERSLRHPGGDPRFFVRFSSWTSATILERLQPLLDRVWAREISVDALAAAVPEINRAVREELSRTARRSDIRPAFLREITLQLEQLEHATDR